MKSKSGLCISLAPNHKLALVLAALRHSCGSLVALVGLATQTCVPISEDNSIEMKITDMAKLLAVSTVSPCQPAIAGCNTKLSVNNKLWQAGDRQIDLLESALELAK